MRKRAKINCAVPNHLSAMQRIEEAGELFEELLGCDTSLENRRVTFACMDMQLESIELLHDTMERTNPEFVRQWIIQRRDLVLEALTKRGLENNGNAQCALKKLEAVLNWVDRWK